MLVDKKHGWYIFEVIVKYLMNTGERLPRDKVVEVVSRVDRKAREAVMTIAEQLRMEGRAEGKVEGKAEGISEGTTKGKAEGKAEILLKQIQLKFGRPSEVTIRKVTKATNKELDLLSERILTAKSIKELFGFSHR